METSGAKEDNVPLEEQPMDVDDSERAPEIPLETLDDVGPSSVTMDESKRSPKIMDELVQPMQVCNVTDEEKSPEERMKNLFETLDKSEESKEAHDELEEPQKTLDEGTSELSEPSVSVESNISHVLERVAIESGKSTESATANIQSTDEAKKPLEIQAPPEVGTDGKLLEYEQPDTGRSMDDVNKNQAEGNMPKEGNDNPVKEDEIFLGDNQPTEDGTEKVVKDGSAASKAPTGNTGKTAEAEKTMDIEEVTMVDFRGDTESLEDNDPIADSERTTEQDKTVNLDSVAMEDNNSGSTLTSPEIDDHLTGEQNFESILAEEDQDKDKYVVSHFNDNEEKDCDLCKQSEIPKYFAQKQLEIIYICNDDCLVEFKNKNVDNYIEKILRLRSFANQDKKDETVIAIEEDKEEEFVTEVDEDFTDDSPQKCRQCKASISLKCYISWEADDYCNEGCLLNFQRTINPECAKCKTSVTEDVIGKFCVRFGNVIIQFCSTSCLLSYKRSYKFCSYCQADLRGCITKIKTFCSKRCHEACLPEHISKDLAYCAVCHLRRTVEVKIRVPDKIDSFCGERCFVAYKFVNQVEPVKCYSCTTYFEPQPEDLVIYSEGIPHLLCSPECQKIYLIKNRKIVVCSNCSVKKYDFDMIKLSENGKTLVSCSNSCLQVYFNRSYKEQVEKIMEPNFKQLEMAVKDGDFLVNGKNLSIIIKCATRTPRVPFHKISLSKPKAFVRQRNVATMCRPTSVSKAVSCRTRDVNVEVQTDPVSDNIFVPVPCPIYVPTPLHMYVQHVPFFFPIPIPLPVPIFIPTARKSIAGILKEIQKIKNRVPADPLEAELLMMAEMAAGEKKEESSSESEAEEVIKAEEPTFPPERIDTTSTSFGEDMLTMALKMASDFEEPVDLEAVVVPTPTPSTQPYQEAVEAAARIENIMQAERKPTKSTKIKVKREPTATAPSTVAIDKGDAHLCLKYTFGVNAWKQWVTMKNQELQKTMKKPKLFKPDILQLSADDLNFSLCLFVKEVRKPNGADYAPDTIFYLCLGIQQFLYENGRIDNIFCDAFYDKFTDTFNEVCQKFANLYNDSQYIVTRVEEEHLWESKQLGAHSPLVLLNTLMFFNTKHFSLTTVEQHLQLSFSHIMKHWKRNPNAPGSRNVLLRFYPPQSSQGRKKKVFEQQENDVNPLRCPVKLYEFYLSKCPESVKTRNDVFYLQPERSCVPDSPVWYSTMAIETIALEKMLNRIKMVKEINVALLTT